MKIIVNTNEFKTAMEKTFKVVNNSKFVPSLENILLTITGNDLYLSATNLEQFTKTKIYADTTENLSFGFSDTKALLKAMKFFTGNEITFDYREKGEKTPGEITISCGGKKVKQNILESDEFANFPELGNTLNNDMIYSNAKLKERFNAINYAVSKSDTKPILQGVCFRNSDMVACDGHRLALNKDENFTVNESFVVSCAAISYVNAIIGENLLIKTDKKYIQFIDEEDGNTIVISRLYDGEYIDYTQNIQKRGEREVEIDIKEYVNGLKYLKIFTKEKTKYPVNWYANKIGLQNLQGYYESEIIINNGDMDMEICFNGNYMEEALSQFKNKVKIYTGREVEPIFLISESGNDIALVLPTRLTKRLFQEAS